MVSGVVGTGAGTGGGAFTSVWDCCGGVGTGVMTGVGVGSTSVWVGGGLAVATSGDWVKYIAATNAKELVGGSIFNQRPLVSTGLTVSPLFRTPTVLKFSPGPARRFTFFVET